MSALALSAAGIPFFESGVLFKIPIGSGIPIQTFGVIVAAGVLIGASLLRRYAEWHGVSDDHIRGLTGWITVTGFIGAHVFDVVAYQWTELEADPLLLFKIWAGISSYGGFLGGAMGFAFYVWWKRLPPRLMADIAVVGLLPAFSIGRIGCSVVSDHIGAATDPNGTFAFLAMDYPRFGDAVLHNSGIAHLVQTNPGTSEFIRAWNLGLIEFLYLVPVNLLILWLAFRAAKRTPAGFVTVLAGLLYAPVRFFLDYLRPETSDPRYFSLTFAQWSSLLAFGAAAYVATKLLKNGAPADTVAPTSGEAQQKLRTLLKEEVAKASDAAKDTPLAGVSKKDLAKAKQSAAAIAAERKAEKTEDQKDTEQKVDEVLEAKKRKEEQDEREAEERRKRQDEEWEAKKAKKAEAEAAAKAAAADKKGTAAAAKSTDKAADQVDDKTADKAADKTADKAEDKADDEADEDGAPLDHAKPNILPEETSGGGKKSGKKSKKK
jgi:phosphatidylglycerol:prolipoprotein diacylglycerol transferase